MSSRLFKHSVHNIIPSANTNIIEVLSSGNPICVVVDSYLNQVQSSLYQESDKMMNQLQELEKQLSDVNDENDMVSMVTNNKWSDRIKNLITLSDDRLSPASSTSLCSSSMKSATVSSLKQSTF
ncbi:hypothetical protein K7X08_020154 [Anisodus acutangulus]|uniref:Uncharacterized protein n=1 Tax=Anisodus acutangulus TaxID=402998 RepID=A0A9Q1M968_9SOLA|nr:hypothetical protein K7X08_020154 [Anisodus acutangulus]